MGREGSQKIGAGTRRVMQKLRKQCPTSRADRRRFNRLWYKGRLRGR